MGSKVPPMTPIRRGDMGSSVYTGRARALPRSPVEGPTHRCRRWPEGSLRRRPARRTRAGALSEAPSGDPGHGTPTCVTRHITHEWTVHALSRLRLSDGCRRSGRVDLQQLREEAETSLRALAGADAELREDQWAAIAALVAEHRRALVVQRTGWGKSAVYFLATALLRARGAGPTVIISPLLALMRNQITAAARAGIHAATMNSANPQEWDEVQARIAAGEVDVLLVSPERLTLLSGFRTPAVSRARSGTAA